MLDNTRPPRGGQDPPALHGTLRLVHPKAPQTQGDPNKPRGRHRRGDPFTEAEQSKLRAALRNARTIFGSWACVDAALGLASGTAECGVRNAVSPEIAIRLAKALGKPLEALYRAPSDSRTCPSCGA